MKRKLSVRLLGCLLAAPCLGLTLHSARANGLDGTSVTGSLTFGAGSTNYYDPANGFVPSGYLNTSGTTVTIASPATEFGFQDSMNFDTANFSASQFTIEDVIGNTVSSTDDPFTMTFTDAAFAGKSFAKVTDFFPDGGLTYSLAGSKLTISWAGGAIKSNDDYTSTFTVAAVPEPSAWVALALGAALLCVRLGRTRRTATL